MRLFALGVLAFGVVLAVGASLAGDGAKPPSPPSETTAKIVPERLDVPAPPFSDGIFPCSNCHAGMPVDRTRRNLEAMHTDIVLKHDETHRWCLDCHDATNRDFLQLARVELVPCEESSRVGGHWHGERLREGTPLPAGQLAEVAI